MFHFTRIPVGPTNSGAVFQSVINLVIADNGLKAIFAYIDDVIICAKNKKDHGRNL